MGEYDETADARGKLSLWWPAVGCAAGLAMAAVGMLDRSAESVTLPDSAVAKINDRIISTDDYRRAVERIETATGGALNAADRSRVLQQLVEEELLVQRGVELGMATTEATVRAAIVQSLVASVTAEADAADPSDADLDSFLAEHAERYTYASATRLAAWTTEDEWLAQDFAQRVRETPNSDLDLPEGIRAVPGLPEGALPPERLRMFLGPAIAGAALDMPANSTAVYARQGRWYVVHVVHHEEGERAELAAVRSQVLLDFRRALADQALRDYVDGLMRRADVVVTSP